MRSNKIYVKARILIFGCFGLALVARSENKPSWQAKMNDLGKIIGELLPEIISKNGNVAIIERDAKALEELSHNLAPDLKSGSMAPPKDFDPSLALIAEKFAEETKFGYRAIHSGNLEYGKNVLRGITSYCIACHTRHDKGPEFPTFPLGANAEKLPPEEKAELFVATRQFDKGLQAFEGLIADDNFAHDHPFDWERVVRRALAISVRVKNDPQLSEKLIDLALKSPGLPGFSKSYLTRWQAAVGMWKKEGNRPVRGEKNLASKMRRLLVESRDNQAFPADHSSEIQYLRASGLAHDLLRQTTNPKLRAEGLLLIGSAYEVLSNPVLWPMHELYYEACVRQLPHSKLAKQCYERYEQSVYIGYTGSAGTNIPDEVQVSLSELKQLTK